MCGPVVVGLAGIMPSRSELEILSNPLVGAVLLFDRNFESAAQLTELCEELRAVRSPPLLIWVDQEGGRIQRFKGSGFTSLPPCSALGEQYDRDPDTGLRLAHDTGWLMATELLLCGIDSSLAPVVDVAGSNDSVIGNRALHSNPEVIARLAESYMRGMAVAGMAGMAKHFPGHGMVTGDTHTASCVDGRTLAAIIQHDLVPYRALMAAGLLRAVMVAHVTYPEVALEPAGYSCIWLREVLRRQLGYTGLVVSDDLGMQAAAVVDDVADRAEACLRAGCDMLIVSESADMATKVLAHIPQTAAIEYTMIAGLRGSKPAITGALQHRLDEVRAAMQRHDLLA